MPLFGSTIARRTLIFMLAGVAALLCIVVTTVWLAARTGDHAEEVVRERDIRTRSAGVLTALLDAETGQRGFLLTGERRYLGPYEDAGPRLAADLGQLRRLVAAEPEAAAAVGRLTALVDSKFAELAETIALATAGRREGALDIVRGGQGSKTMDDARSLLAGLIAASEARVAGRLAALNDAADTLTRVALAGGALVLLFAAGASWTVVRYTQEVVAARRAVETANASLEERVAERTAELSRANDEIQRFAYIVSHDLRSPLVNVMGFTSEMEVGVDTLQKFVADPADAALAEAARTAANEDIPEAVRFIRAATGKMDRLINAILKLSREGRRALKAERVELRALFAAAAASVQHQLDEAGGRVELPARMPVIHSDRLALEQVTGNLIDNAVKYRAPDRPIVITVTSEERGGRVLVTVRDNGRGIAEQDHERIFELFRRAGAQDTPGEGIGLAHVRALVRRLGGDIGVRSTLGEGSAFQIHLPRTLKANESIPPP